MTNKVQRSLRILSIERRKAVRAIIAATEKNEQRWLNLRNYFLRTDPSLVDNMLAWNIYKLSLEE